MPGIVMERSLEEEYKKTGIKPADIAALRKWLKTQPHLPEKYISGNVYLFIKKFQVYSIQRTKCQGTIYLSARVHRVTELYLTKGSINNI